MDSIFTKIMVFLYITVVSFFIGCAVGEHQERKLLANKLCSEQQYDFCQVEVNKAYDFKNLGD